MSPLVKDDELLIKINGREFLAESINYEKQLMDASPLDKELGSEMVEVGPDILRLKVLFSDSAVEWWGHEVPVSRRYSNDIASIGEKMINFTLDIGKYTYEAQLSSWDRIEMIKSQESGATLWSYSLVFYIEELGMDLVEFQKGSLREARDNLRDRKIRGDWF